MPQLVTIDAMNEKALTLFDASAFIVALFHESWMRCVWHQKASSTNDNQKNFEIYHPPCELRLMRIICLKNEVTASGERYQHCHKWPFLSGGCKPRTSFYGNVDITPHWASCKTPSGQMSSMSGPLYFSLSFSSFSPARVARPAAYEDPSRGGLAGKTWKWGERTEGGYIQTTSKWGDIQVACTPISSTLILHREPLLNRR